MPTIFPIQTKIKVSVSYFYCRNRTVHDEFEDFIFRTKPVVQPWLRLDNARAKKMISTGSLGDFLGVCTTVGRVGTGNTFFEFEKFAFTKTDNPNDDYLWDSDYIISRSNSGYPFTLDALTFDDNYASYYRLFWAFSSPIHKSLPSTVRCKFVPRTPPYSDIISNPNIIVVAHLIDADNINLDLRLPIKIYPRFASSVRLQAVNATTSEGFHFYVDLPSEFIEKVNTNLEKSALNTYIAFSFLNLDGSDFYPYIILQYESGASPYETSFFTPSLAPTASYGLDFKNFNYTYPTETIVDATDDVFINQNPHVGSNPSIPLNALPFRHYEQVMNYYFRNDVNNPYYINGEPQYNEFIPSHASGADDNVYDFHYHNWELDKFTSAQQSPQFGAAPLVGLTFSGSNSAELSFMSENGNTYKVTVGLDGETITSITDFDKDVPSANLRQLMNVVNYGISINDFRMGNAYQRFKENMLRRGLRYRNQLKSHFGVSVDYPDIDVPQYIGGYTGILDSSKIVNTADSPNAGLGDFVGNLSGMVSSNNDITVYCPEHGIILGVMSIVPVPVYSQSSKKLLIKNDPFDYFIPEFSKIGFVPIHYSEVSPMQTPSGKSPDDVFGYQKAWYDYLQNTDEVHGDFKTSLHDFVLQRLFAERPTLGNDFVRVSPFDLNGVFVANNIADAYGSTDKFMVNCQHAIVSKRVVPVHGTPSLE